MRLQRTSFMAAAVLAATVSACGGGGGDKAPTQPGGGTTPVLTSLTISAPSTSVAVSGSLQLTVSPKDQNGNAMSALIVWSSSAPAIAAVNASGVMIGVDPGSATLTAQSGSVSAAIGITVTGGGTFPAQAAVTMPGNLFSPVQTDIAVNGTVTFQFAVDAHNVLFSAASGAPSDIPVTANANVPRQFTARGAFPYVCTLHPGMQGTIVVH